MASTIIADTSTVSNERYNTLDGLHFDYPPTEQQIVALAHAHRRNLDAASLDQNVHLGNFCLKQRKHVYDFTRQYEYDDRVRFYSIYNGELLRIADEDDLHPADSERGVGIFAIFVVMAIVAAVLYYTVIRVVFY
ncbi:hypothetical protein NVT87_13440 [Acinetobacter radioresistens]|jgi:hypothetical protein|uniref:Uncharacterized protein n=2 Tax=Acinetobacter radioresistens TaxID=40216 RepID=A0A2T1IWP9_ACIRA|nr:MULTISPECIES: hypothetical protein [Acinetobacter]AWV86377.1 hypothetical protein DOM24_07210 [Acinetobacter radioresistens]EET82576.1 hypothetical protein ACIRA0001_1794 [Acinetobacter radioresistens SK82]EEY87242.1 hypothetical protein HMPREF0018_01815 [Acinetobacter radioresistens SH164]ENV84471.1 hypothetical protein F940_03001 [Acinetobacter radioresistens NIPH 2130]ENV88253.1 hypothetical protein F939_01878 [Acinetobacter radioresistens DSM 6976 = NBRC 102413 = CIP 103788]